MPGPVGRVRTVTGDVHPGDLGVTYSHEHLLTRPRAGIATHDPDLVLDDEDRAERMLRTFREAGGGTLVECTAPEYGRDAAALRRLSRRTGVGIVAVTGHVTEHFWEGVVDVAGGDPARFAERFVADLLVGMGDTDVRAGVIKVGSSEHRVTDDERLVHRAAGAAQRRTGAPITTHTTAGTAALEQIRSLDEAGADLSRVCVGHLDRRLVWEDHLAVARTGVYLGYDQISKEKYQPDSERARFVAALVDAGFGDRICLAGDLARRSYHPAWGGGPGLAYLLEQFVPRLRAHGLSEGEVRSLLVDNPARHLTWQAADGD